MEKSLTFKSGLHQIPFVFLCLFMCIYQTGSVDHLPECPLTTLEEQGLIVEECLPDKTKCNITCKTSPLNRSWRQCAEGQWNGPLLICPEDDTKDENIHFIKKRSVKCMFNGCVPRPTNRGSDPVLRCPSNIQQIADPFQTHAKVTWIEPDATDDRDGKIKPRRYGLGPGKLFSEGRNTVGYSARDRAGNMASCTFYIDIRVVRCTVPERIQDGWRICHPTTEFIRSAVCVAGCYGGHELSGDQRFRCLDSGHWSSTIPSCDKRKCPELKRGPTEPATITCTNKNYYRSKCTFVCDKGYGVASGKSRVQICQEDGTWRGSRPVCLDIERPEFSVCPNNILRVLDKGKSIIVVNWMPPVVTDNSRKEIKPVLEKGLSPGSIFTVGTHVIEYSAKDSAGNVAKPCRFKVVVREIRCHTLYPSVYQTILCPDGYKRGSTCKFSCAENTGLNTELNTTECQKTGVALGPPYGVWTFGRNQPVCEVKTLCPKLLPPANGALVCDNWYGGKLCQLLCKSGYDLPRENRDFNKHELFVCGNSGSWNRDVNFPLKVPKQCSRRRLVGSSRLLMRASFYFNGDCEDATTQATMKENFINIVRKKDLCPENSGCMVINVKIFCGKTRRKRSENSTDDDAIHSAEITVVVNFIDTDTENSVTNRTAAVIRNLVKLENTTFPVDNETVSVYSIDKPALTIACPDGFIPASDSLTCSPCPVGSFHDKTTKQCSKCSKGYFQNKEGQTECIECPAGSTTVTEGAIDTSLCKRGCEPGSISGTGIPPCSPCSIGEYQPEAGETSCIQCPGSKLTDTEGATNISECSDFDIQSVLTANKSVAEVVLEKPEGIQEISLCFWIRCSECDNVVSLFDEDYSSFLQLSIANDTGTFTVGRQSFNLEMTSTAMKWHFISMYVGGGVLKIWKGGKLEIDENAILTSPNFTTVQLGGEGFIGSISQFNIWNTSQNFISTDNKCDNIPSGNLVSWREFARAGFENSFIDIPSSCDDTDNCKSQPCGNNAVCEDSLNDVICTCPDGFDGKYCHINLNDCLEDVCMNNGTCVDDVNDYHCDCPSGFSGKYCEMVVVDGGWTEFGNWTTCSVTCGNGTRSRKRLCDNPSPDNGGKNCEGNDTEVEECSLTECRVCEKIDAPEHGYLTCVNDTDTIRCQVNCDEGYMADIPPLIEYMCGPSTFHEWNYHSDFNPYKRLPYCSKVRPAATLEVTFTGVYYQINCNTPRMGDDFTAKVKQEVTVITSKLDCMRIGKCEVGKVTVDLCGNAASRIKRSVETTDEATVSVTIMTSHSLDSSDKVKQLTQAVTNLETSVDNGEFDVEISDKIYRLNKNETKSTGKAGCPDGSWSYDAFCVPCGMGSFMENGQCELCDYGQYTDKESQTSCTACPTGRTTRGIGSRHPSECDVPVQLPQTAGLPGVYIGLVVLSVVSVIVVVVLVLLLLRKRLSKKTNAFDASAYQMK